jgi:hypothetical protein
VCLEYDHGTRLLVTSRRWLVLSPELAGRLGTRQAELSLDAGLPHADAIALLGALDVDGRLGIRSAPSATTKKPSLYLRHRLPQNKARTACRRCSCFDGDEWLSSIIETVSPPP